MRRLAFSTLVILILLLSLGCSTVSKQPVQPLGITPDSPDNTFPLYPDNRIDSGMLFNGTIEINPATGTILIDERALSANYNITGFLASGCPGGCFRFTIQSLVDDVMTIDLEIENPTALQVYDMRIIFTGLYGKTVLNPDNYTNLYDPPSGLPYNPQIAFTKSDDTRAFPIGPGSTDNQTLRITFPVGSNPMVDFVIVASLPNQCNEPFEIFDKVIWAEMSPSGGYADISIRFKDHQYDVLTVAADTTDFTGGLTFFDYMYGSDRYTATIYNTESAPAGIYTILFGGMSPGSSVILYDFFQIQVVYDNLEFETPRAIDEYPFQTSFDTFTQGGRGINGHGDNIYLIYFITDQNTDQQVDLMRSLDGGNTFESPVTRVNTDDPSSIHISPAFDITPNGTIHAVWCRGDQSGYGSNLEYARSFDDGVTFEPDIYMSGFLMELWSDITVADNNKVHAIRNGAPYMVFNVYAQSSTDAGNTWSTDIDLSDYIFPSPSSNELFPVMDSDSQGNVFITFMSDYSPEEADVYGVYLTKSSDDGVSYSSAIQINDVGNSMRLPTIACDSRDFVHSAWVDLEMGTYDDIRYSYSYDGGNSFVASMVVDDVDSDVNEPVLCIDPNNDRIYLVYKAGNIRITMSDDGWNWSDSVDLGTTGTGFNMYIDHKSRIHLSWSAGGHLYYTRSV